jgi:hypothetical protein
MVKKAKKKPAKPGVRKSWSKADLRTLGAMVKKGATSTAIGRELRRSANAVRQKVYDMGLSLGTAAKKAKKVGRKVVKVAKAKVTGAKAAKAKVMKRPARARTKPAKPVVASQPIPGGMDGTVTYPVAAAPEEAAPIEAKPDESPSSG